MAIEKFGGKNMPEERSDPMLESSKQHWFSYLEQHKNQIPQDADGVILTTQEEPGAPGVFFLWIQEENGGHILLRLADGYKPNVLEQGIVDESGQLTRTFEPAYAVRFSLDGNTVGDLSELSTLKVSGESYYYDKHNQLEGISHSSRIEDQRE